MTFTPRMVALDIDGTLVNHQGELPHAVREAVAKIDVPVVLATGRGLFGAVPIHEALGLQGGHAVVSNGAVTATMSPLKVQTEITFDPRPIIDHVMDVYPQALIAVEEVGVDSTSSSPSGSCRASSTSNRLRSWHHALPHG